MYNWNKVYKLVMEIKRKYEKENEIEEYNLDKWIGELGIQEYIDFIDPVQTTHFDNMVLIRYGLAEMQPGFWEDPESIYRQCRSVVIDLKGEELVLTPFEKFFNINEVSENSVENIEKMIKNAKNFEITDKLDGSMVSARYYKGRYVISTSKSLDKTKSWRLNAITKDINNNKEIKRMMKELPDYTFVFEYISLQNEHVVVYSERQEGLYLIGMINSLTGKEERYTKIIETAKKYNVKHTEQEKLTLDEMLDLMTKYKSNEKEGWVMDIDGHKVKIKCDDYVNIHRIIGTITSVNLVIEHIADNSYDDLISKVPSEYRSRVEKTAETVFEYMSKMTERVKELYKESPKGDIKEFMLWVDKRNKIYRGYLRSQYLGKEVNVVKSGERYLKMKEIENRLEIMGRGE